MKKFLLASLLTLCAFSFSAVYTPTATAADDDATVLVKKGKKKGKKGKKKGKKKNKKNNTAANQFVAAKAAKKAKKGAGDNEALFKKLDTDSDGKLSKDEFSKVTEQVGKKKPDAAKAAKKAGKVAGKVDAEFSKLDDNKDGSLSLDEFKKFNAADLKVKKKS